jgi:hypothetical protein
MIESFQVDRVAMRFYFDAAIGTFPLIQFDDLVELFFRDITGQ